MDRAVDLMLCHNLDRLFPYHLEAQHASVSAMSGVLSTERCNFFNTAEMIWPELFVGIAMTQSPRFPNVQAILNLFDRFRSVPVVVHGPVASSLPFSKMVLLTSRQLCLEATFLFVYLVSTYLFTIAFPNTLDVYISFHRTVTSCADHALPDFALQRLLHRTSAKVISAIDQLHYKRRAAASLSKHHRPLALCRSTLFGSLATCAAYLTIGSCRMCIHPPEVPPIRRMIIGTRYCGSSFRLTSSDTR